MTNNQLNDGFSFSQFLKRIVRKVCAREIQVWDRTPPIPPFSGEIHVVSFDEDGFTISCNSPRDGQTVTYMPIFPEDDEQET